MKKKKDSSFLSLLNFVFVFVQQMEKITAQGQQSNLQIL